MDVCVLLRSLVHSLALARPLSFTHCLFHLILFIYLFSPVILLNCAALHAHTHTNSHAYRVRKRDHSELIQPKTITCPENISYIFFGKRRKKINKNVNCKMCHFPRLASTPWTHPSEKGKFGGMFSSLPRSIFRNSFSIHNFFFGESEEICLFCLCLCFCLSLAPFCPLFLSHITSWHSIHSWDR